MTEKNEAAEPPKPRFSRAVSASLMGKFKKAYASSNPDSSSDDASSEAECFVSCLEGLACEWPEMETSKRRKERLEALANALDTVADVALKMDDPVLGYAIHCGLAAMVKRSDYDDADRAEVARLAGFESIFLAYRLQHEMRTDIEAFCYGVRASIASLPPLDKRYSTEFMAAKFIEDFLGRRGIQVTTTDTGLAGAAFLETVKLSGRDTARAGYWINLAINDEDSWASFTKRLSARDGNDL